MSRAEEIRAAAASGWASLSKSGSQLCYVLGCGERILRDGDGEPREFKHRAYGYVPSCERHQPDRLR
jgi:hypothetical protein